MDPSVIAATRSALAPTAVYADWAARALPLLPIKDGSVPHFQPHPHSSLPPPFRRASSRPHRSARNAVAKLFNVDSGTHDVVLTAGATAALHIVAERLPWAPGDVFVCHASAHTALLGLRAPAVASGASFVVLDTGEVEDALGDTTRLNAGQVYDCDADNSSSSCRPPFVLFGFPGECNLTGARYPVSRWCAAASKRGWARRFLSPNFQRRLPTVLTVVDAAALVASTPIPRGTLDCADLVCMSAYKLVGSPTGVGALLVRRDSDASALLCSTAKQAYFAGGRSAAAVGTHSAAAFCPPSSVLDSLELGTPNLDALVALPFALARIDADLGGMEHVSSRAESVAEYFRLALLRALPDGRAVIHYDEKGGSSSIESYGPIVSFSVFSAENTPVGYNDVAAVMALHDIHVRVGAMCNPGAMAAAVCAAPEDILADISAGGGYRCGDGMDVVRGRHTGVVRASFGWASTEGDAKQIVRVLSSYWGIPSNGGKSLNRGHDAPDPVSSDSMSVSSLFAYAVKGFRGVEVEKALTCNGGMQGDRVAGVICKQSGELLNGRSAPQLASLTAHVTANKLVLSGPPGCRTPPLELDMNVLRGSNLAHPFCGSAWLTEVTGGVVLGQLSAPLGDSSFANRDGSVHIVSSASCARVARELGNGWDSQRIACAARANIVVKSENDDAWKEDSWVSAGSIIRIGQSVTIGGLEGCRRCSVINVEKSEPLRTIVRLRREAGCTNVMLFGIVGRVLTKGAILQGDPCVIDRSDIESPCIGKEPVLDKHSCRSRGR